MKKMDNYFKLSMVGDAGLEPAASASRTLLDYSLNNLLNNIVSSDMNTLLLTT